MPPIGDGTQDNERVTPPFWLTFALVMLCFAGPDTFIGPRHKTKTHPLDQHCLSSPHQCANHENCREGWVCML